MVHFTRPPLGTSATARKLELSEGRIRQLVEAGLLPAVRTARGQLLFDPADVEKFASQRDLDRERRAQ
jgi:excisionase family DNA binding protein